MANTFKELSGFGWSNIVLIFLLSIMFAVALLQSIKYLVEYFGIETKQSLKEKERDRKIKTLEGKIETLEKSANKFNEDRTHDREQSFEIQHDLIENLSQVFNTLKDIRKDLLEERVERKRSNIINFADELRHNNQGVDTERFNNILRDCDDYERIIHDNDMKNGFAEESMKFIKTKYQEMLNN